MSHALLAVSVFAAAYLLNVFYITVIYHRGITHGAVKLSPGLLRVAVATGNWITGLDPKGWACMHRMHHQHSDTERDPHSPWNLGIFGVMLGQLRSYQRVLVNLQLRREPYASTVRDLEFEVNWLNRKRLWWLPYVAHAGIALLIGALTGAWLVGGAYWLGMMSHPIQGWMVNSFAHRYGYRNFDLTDQSRNNTWVAWLVFGEGYQNNHHARPASAQFAVRWFEWDAGYWLCRAARALGWLEIAGSDEAASSDHWKKQPRENPTGLRAANLEPVILASAAGDARLRTERELRPSR